MIALISSIVVLLNLINQVTCVTIPIPKQIVIESTSKIYLRLETGQLLIGNRKVFQATPVASVNVCYEFLGVPFAQPPLKELRFRYPSRLSSTFPQNAATYNATFHRLQCTQTSAGRSGEDCLHFNVWVPVTKQQDDLIYLQNSKVFENNLDNLKYIPNAFLFNNAPNKTTMFWIHGGAFENGSGNDEDGSVLSTVENVIVVAINYRLGSFGFLYLNTSNNVAPGSMGLADQLLAIEWYREKYLNFFGGASNSVTLFGCSAGAMGIQNLLLTNKNYLFNRVIMQSSFYPVSYVKPASLIAPSLNLAQQAGCQSTNPDEILACLQATDPKTLQKISAMIWEKGDTVIGPSTWSPNSAFLNFSQTFQGDVFRGFDQNEIPMFLPYYELSSYFNSKGLPNFNPFTSYDNNFVYQVLLKSVKVSNYSTPQQSKAYSSCLNNLYNTAFLKDDYSGYEDFNLQPGWMRHTKKSMNLAWYGKISKILGDLATNCPAIEFNSTMKITGKNYLYKFNYLYSYSESTLVLHCDESYFLFGGSLTDPYSNEVDRVMDLKIMNFWANFAKTGQLFSKYDGNRSRNFFCRL